MAYTWRNALTDAKLEPETKLVMAIIGQAWEDLKKGPEESLSAFEWLLTEGAELSEAVTGGELKLWDVVRNVVYSLDGDILLPLNAIVVRRLYELASHAVDNEELIGRVAALLEKRGYKVTKA